MTTWYESLATVKDWWEALAISDDLVRTAGDSAGRAAAVAEDEAASAVDEAASAVAEEEEANGKADGVEGRGC